MKSEKGIIDGKPDDFPLLLDNTKACPDIIHTINIEILIKS